MSAVNSPMQRRLTSAGVTGLLRTRFGPTAVHCGPLSGGTFARERRERVTPPLLEVLRDLG